jgi:ACR3 family arsenite transporter
LFLKVVSHDFNATAASYFVVAISVAVFLGTPLGPAVIARFSLRKLVNAEWYDNVFLKWAPPWSLIGLLYTVLVLFASQKHQVVHQIVSVVRVAAPLVVYFIIIFCFTLWLTHRLGFGYKASATQSFTAASNNFEWVIG